MTNVLDIIIPTFNNQEYLNPCIQSIVQTGELLRGTRLIIVNNGSQPIESFTKGHPNIVVLSPGKNLGWEGGLKYGLEHSSAPFVVFQNDDTFIPQANSNLYQAMLLQFADKSVGAAGPTTTTCAGIQSIYHHASPLAVTNSRYLIFFTAMIRRSALDHVGGIDTTLPGGDDIDLSMRMWKAGYKCLVVPAAFLIHHGFKTGERVHGTQASSDGWNSREMTERTNMAIIQKHGFREFFETLTNKFNDGIQKPGEGIDLEGNLVRKFVIGENIVELGCGGNKTVENSIGIDRVAKGEIIKSVGAISVADLIHDVSEPLPLKSESVDTLIARHVLEHLQDPIKVVLQWAKCVKIGGRVIIAVPDQDQINGIPMNPEHLHSYTEESLLTLMEKCGFSRIHSEKSNNMVSFVGVYERVVYA